MSPRSFSAKFLVGVFSIAVGTFCSGGLASPSSCEDIFQTTTFERTDAKDVAEDSPDVSDKDRDENEAIQALRTMAQTPQQVAAHVHDWISRFEAKQARGETLTVLEYTAVSYLIRSQVLDPLAHDQVQARADAVLRNSWQRLTGRKALGSNYLGRLPKSVLYGQSREVLLFHFASFEEEGRKEGLYYPSPLENYVPEANDFALAAGPSIALVALAFSQSGRVDVACAIGGFLAVSTIEHVLHRFPGHPTPQMKELFKSFGWLGQPLLDAGISHAIVHHLRTFRRHTEQFQSDAEKEKLDQELDANESLSNGLRADIKRSQYGLTLKAKGVAIIIGVTAPILWTVSRILHLDPVATAALMSPMIVQTWVPKYLHGLVHKKLRVALAHSNAIMASLPKTRLVEGISRSHYIHHRGGGGNYNLVPGADWLFGQYRRPNLRQVFQMRDLEVIGAVWEDAAP